MVRLELEEQQDGTLKLVVVSPLSELAAATAVAQVLEEVAKQPEPLDQK